jgi:hypothetical protein
MATSVSARAEVEDGSGAGEIACWAFIVRIWWLGGVWAIRPARAHQLALGGPLARASRAHQASSAQCLHAAHFFLSLIEFDCCYAMPG